MTMIVAAQEPGGTVRPNPTPARSKPTPTAELATAKPAPRVARVSGAAVEPKRPAQDRPRASRTSHDAPKPSKRAPASLAKAKGVVERVRPAEVVALMAEHGVSRKAFASALGVTVSRVSEMVTDRRPGSHVRRDRWPAMVKAAKAAAKDRPMA